MNNLSTHDKETGMEEFPSLGVQKKVTNIVAYIMNARIPTEKAHGYQIAKMCEALAVAGGEVMLVVPTRKNDVQGDIFSYYDIRNNFSVKYVDAFDALTFFHGTRLAYYLQALCYLIALSRQGISSDAVVITRSPEIAWWYARKGYQVFFDAHSFSSRSVWLLRWLLRKTSGIIANSTGTAEAFRGVGFSNILTVPNAVDLTQFTSVETESRGKYGLPAGRIAMYVGHLYGWKGVETVLEAARLSRVANLTFVFVGGTDHDLIRLRNETKDISNVLFMGRFPHQDVPALIKSADVLLLPNIPSTQESILYTSPIKMFEYMASGVPIVASSLPSIREVLNNANSILVEPGNGKDLLRGVNQVLTGSTREVAIQAKKDVKEYTWESRAQKIFKFIKRQ